MASRHHKHPILLGGEPAITVTPSSWSFGSTPVGTPVSKIFTIENTGTRTLEITLPITIVGAEASAFTVTAQPGSTSLAPGASTTFTVQADADVVDTFNADISIVNNSSENPKLVAIEATVTWIPQLLPWVVLLDDVTQNTMYQDSARTTLAAATNPVGGWSDQSGTANHATQATTGNKPIRNAAGSGANWDSTDDYLDIANAASIRMVGDQSFAVLIKAESTGEASAGHMYSYEGKNSFLLFTNGTLINLDFRVDGVTTDARAVTTTGVTANVPTLLICVLDNNVPKVFKAVGGVVSELAYSIQTSLAGGVSVGTLGIRLGNTSTVRTFDGDIRMFGAINRVLTADEMQKLATYYGV